MFIRHNSDKVLIGIVVLIFFVAVGYQPEYRLNSKMPSEFFREDRHSPNSFADRKIAWAYWETAEMDIQWKWGYARPLPADPPPEFRIDAAALGPAASNPALRLMYWRRLQEVWPLPDTWKKEYGWRLDWLSHPLTSIAEWIKNTGERMFSY
jgi:hypothetical protein